VSASTVPGGGAGDHEELRSLIQRYARAADDRDVDGLAALFHPEAEVTGARGTQGIDEWLDTMRAPRTFPTSMHALGDPLITLEPGADRATLDTYGVVYQLGDPGSDSGDLTLGIRYLDDVERLSGGWLIRRRTARTLWMR
jgi:SnoaL-like domain